MWRWGGGGGEGGFVVVVVVVCVCACVHACVRACVCACVRACIIVCIHALVHLSVCLIFALFFRVVSVCIYICLSAVKHTNSTMDACKIQQDPKHTRPTCPCMCSSRWWHRRTHTLYHSHPPTAGPVCSRHRCTHRTLWGKQTVMKENISNLLLLFIYLYFYTMV